MAEATRMAFSVSISEQCHSCGVCMDVCPVNALDMTPPSRSSIEGGRSARAWMMEFPVLVGKCTGCRLCEAECPFNAIAVKNGAAPIRERISPGLAASMAARPGAGAPRAKEDWQRFHSLSSLTREVGKRPVRSPFPKSAGWKPFLRAPGGWRVWRTMKAK